MSKIASFILVYLKSLRLLWQAAPFWALCSLAMAIVSALVIPFQIWMLKTVIDFIISSQPGSLGVVSPDFEWTQLIPIASLLLLAWIIQGASFSLNSTINDLLGYKLTAHLDYIVQRKIASLDTIQFESSGFHDKLSIVNRDKGHLTSLVYVLFSTIMSVIASSTLFILLWQLHPVAPVGLILLGLPQTVMSGYGAKIRYNTLTLLAPTRRLIDYISELFSKPEAIKEIKVFSADGYFSQKVQKLWDSFFNTLKISRMTIERRYVSLGILTSLGVLAIWIYAGWNALTGVITVGTMTLYLQATDSLKHLLNTVFGSIGILVERMLFVKTLFEIVDSKHKPYDVPVTFTPIAEKEQRVQLDQGIVLENVSFRYPNATKLALDQISLTIKPKETIALVGRNGAGKTTLVKLLCKLYAPSSGNIYINGKNLVNIESDHLWKGMAVLFQDFIKYPLSARENIGVGDLRNIGNDERIHEVVGLSGASGIVTSLPYGIDTILDKRFEGGVDLSGGEWQRIALARGVIRNADILIMDEPTAALDARSEYELFNTISDLTKDKICLYISHRFSTLKTADRILVIDNGRIAEIGTHQELMELKGIYAELFNYQAERYRTD